MCPHRAWGGGHRRGALAHSGPASGCSQRSMGSQFECIGVQEYWLVLWAELHKWPGKKGALVHILNYIDANLGQMYFFQSFMTIVMLCGRGPNVTKKSRKTEKNHAVVGPRFLSRIHAHSFPAFRLVDKILASTSQGRIRERMHEFLCKWLGTEIYRPCIWVVRYVVFLRDSMN